MKFARALVLTLSFVCLTFEVGAQEIKLRIGTEPSFPPFEFTPEGTNDLTGFDIDIMNAIAESSGFEVEWQPLPFDGLIPAVLSNTLDAAISGFTMNEERKKRVAFSEPYYTAGQNIMINRKDADMIKGYADLEGKTICVQIGSVGAQLAEEVKDARILTYNTTVESYMELNKGGCQAFITGTPVHQYYLTQTKDQNLVMLPETKNAAGLGIVMNKNNKDVQKLINDGYAKIKESGVYQKIYDKWFSSGNN